MGARGHEKLKKRSSSLNFRKLWLSSQNSCVFPRISKWRPKKKSSFLYFHKVWLSSQSFSDFPQILKWKQKKGFRPKISTKSGCRLKILAIFHDFWSEDQKKKKKRSSSQNLHKIRWKFTKITKTQLLLTNSRAVNTNLGVLGLDLHSRSPESVNFFGAQSSLGGHNFRLGGTSSHLGGTAPECPPPRGAGPDACKTNSLFKRAKMWIAGSFFLLRIQ